MYNIPSPSEPGTKQFSQNVAARIDREVAAITRRAYDHALELVRQKEPELNKLADQLLKTDVLHFDDVLSILGPRPHEAASTAPHIGV